MKNSLPKKHQYTSIAFKEIMILSIEKILEKENACEKDAETLEINFGYFNNMKFS